jgi:hypothetical protein
MQLGDEARHLYFEGFTVVFDFLGTNIAARRENMSMCGNFGGRDRFAEAGDVLVFARDFLSSPRMVDKMEGPVVTRNVG